MVSKTLYRLFWNKIYTISNQPATLFVPKHFAQWSAATNLIFDQRLNSSNSNEEPVPDVENQYTGDTNANSPVDLE